ncbi:MAG: DNA-processing protein DprA [Phototrophicales bacterium]
MFPLDEQAYWLGFSLIPGIGSKRILSLLHQFGSLKAAWHASDSDIKQAQLGDKTTHTFLKKRGKIDLQTYLKQVKAVGAWLLIYTDTRYPKLLRQLDDPPAVLYVRGTLQPSDSQALGIVGTRKATRYGYDATIQISRDLAMQGITIVSGLAQGIDAAAHRGALNGGGRTLAVLGCGIDTIYPQEHKELAHQIIQHGALISEFPLGTKPIGANFPRRNRLISGLSLGVLVTEAPEKSGSLITASMAAEQGREVFALPHNIYSKQGYGTNRLIQDGAKLVIEIGDILSELRIAHQIVETRISTEQISPANETEQHILNHLTVDPIHIDDLTRLCGLSIAEVTSTLTILELKGLAQMVGHMQYSRTLT